MANTYLKEQDKDNPLVELVVCVATALPSGIVRSYARVGEVVAFCALIPAQYRSGVVPGPGAGLTDP